MAEGWHPASWRERIAAQQPSYADADALAAAETALSTAAPIAQIGESRILKGQLASAAAGRATLLQAGDCAELFGPRDLAPFADLLNRLADTLSMSSGEPVVRIGRIAGQFAKPRSRDLDQQDTISLPVWRGDIVNDRAFTAEARRPDPARMVQAHREALATKIALDALPRSMFTSHEALLLPYEQALVRRDDGGIYWSTSGHLLWVGDRTRHPEGAHVEFLRGIANPIGIKCGPTLDPDTLLALCDRLDPAREPGRLTLIVRLGADRIDHQLPGLLKAVRGAGRTPLWVCDPMHGNTAFEHGRKVRRTPAITAEALAFQRLCTAQGVWPGGLHLELSADPVQECLSESDTLPDERPACDPRLNPDQAAALIAAVAALRQPDVAA